MFLHTTPTLSLYFGDASDNLSPALMREAGTTLVAQEPFVRLKKSMPYDSVIFQHQVHGVDGMLIDEKNKMMSPFAHDGDFLITQAKKTGLGILTADCLPIIFYDPEHNAIANAHAGWRGSVQEIAVKTLQRMEENFGTQKNNVTIFFGPCAKKCCYEIQPDFMHNLEPFLWHEKTVRSGGSKLYFDVSAFNQLLLENYGVPKNSIIMDYNVCTMCDASYFSHRRQPANPGRQMTVACLR